LLKGQITAKPNEREAARIIHNRNTPWLDATKTLSSQSAGPEEMPMRLPSNVRSLFAFGVFCAIGGAWLTLVTEVRTWPLHGDTNVAFAAPESNGEPRSPQPKPTESEHP
jgi:hypothetical protein